MSEFKQTVVRAYESFFVKTWSPLIGGIMVTIFAVFLEAWFRPWGIVGGIRNWADWFFYGIGFYEDMPPHPLHFSSSVLDIGFIWGAFIAACLSREFSFRVPPLLEFAKAVVSGILMGIGAGLAMGCNIGGFVVALHNLSGSALLMMVGLIAGVRLGLSYLFWEMEHLPMGGGFEIGVQKISPYLGFLAFVGLIVATYAYFGSDLDNGEILGGCLIITAGIGFAMHRSRLCVVNAFREPFMTGMAEMGRAISVSIILGAIGVAILKYQEIRPEMMYVTPTFGIGAILGGFIFGLGMVVAGGCGSGTLWRVAEGQLKLWVVAVVFALTNSIVRYYLSEYDIIEDGKLGKAVFLPDYLGYGGAVFLIALVMVIWYLVVDWNEETNKFVMEI